MKRIKHWIAKKAVNYLKRSGNLLLVYTDDMGGLNRLNGDGQQLGGAAIQFVNKDRQVFAFFAAVVISYLVEYQTEERGFFDKLKEAKKEAAENFRRPN